MSIFELIELIAVVIVIIVSYFGAVRWFAHLNAITNILQQQHSDLAKSYSKADERMIISLHNLRRKIDQIEQYLAKNQDYHIRYEDQDY